MRTKGEFGLSLAHIAPGTPDIVYKVTKDFRPLADPPPQILYTGSRFPTPLLFSHHMKKSLTLMPSFLSSVADGCRSSKRLHGFQDIIVAFVGLRGLEATISVDAGTVRSA